MKMVRVSLDTVPSEMAAEELLKQVAHISREIDSPRISDDGRTLEFEFTGEVATIERTREQVASLATKMLKSLRRLQRKVLYRSAEGWGRAISVPGAEAGVWFAGEGQAHLAGPALMVASAVKEVLTDYIAGFAPVDLQTPVLIPAAVLARCDYFRSFPQYVTFASHLHEEFSVIDGFRQRHQDRDTLDEAARQDLDLPGVCLSPAVCYHIYHRHAGESLLPAGLTYAVEGRCFRFESTNMSDLRRLWEFTMRELVFTGTKEWVLESRERAIQAFIPILEALQLPAEIRTASDPFFVAPDANAKTYFQLSSETKYEISAEIGAGERLAVGSFNYHTDFFGRAFDTRIGEGHAHSVCVAFGLERLVFAILAHHGADPAGWPQILRRG